MPAASVQADTDSPHWPVAPENWEAPTVTRGLLDRRFAHLLLRVERDAFAALRFSDSADAPPSRTLADPSGCDQAE
jgi:hypothetical protein